MRISSRALLRGLGVGLAVLILVGLSAAAMPFVKNWWVPQSGTPLPAGTYSDPPSVQEPGLLKLSMETVRTLGIRTVEARRATEPRHLEMFGQLDRDQSRLSRVRARFVGDVIEIGEVLGHQPGNSRAGPTRGRPLQYGDKVDKGQLLAVIWSKDLGEKKSELVDNLTKFLKDEEVLKDYLEYAGSVPPRSITEQKDQVKSDIIAVTRARRTLASWGIPEEEIKALEAEAHRLYKLIGIGGKAALEKANDRERDEKWARWEVRAPLSGTIIENNLSLGEHVDPAATTLPLFQIADQSRLSVFAYPYEEDLRLLQALPRPIQWSIRLKSDPKAKPLHGTIDILPAIEPNQRTLILRGHVENPEEQLLAGQAVTAMIDLPPPPDEVVIPATALVEDGREAIVFVQPDRNKLEYTLRRVAVMRRQRDVVYVRSQSPQEKGEIAGDERVGKQSPLQPGDRVVVSGAVLLKAALEDLQDGAQANWD